MGETLELTPRHHAMLYALLVRHALAEIGPECEADIIRLTIEYGRQRGRRMAQRTLQDGRELTVENYLVYGEWIPAPGEMEMEFHTKDDELNMVVRKCSWEDEWQKRGMLSYGKYYCLYIDRALGEGYSQDFVLDTPANRTCGAEFCDYYFRPCRITAADLAVVSAEQKQAGNSVKESWSYHIGHLCKTMKEGLAARYGQPALDAVNHALEQYELLYGKAAREDLRQYEQVDFEQIRPYVSNLIQTKAGGNGI